MLIMKWSLLGTATPGRECEAQSLTQMEKECYDDAIVLLTEE
jgi:hypothetical protein